MKTLLLQHVYPDLSYFPLMLEYFERNARYCAEREIDYRASVSAKVCKVGIGDWDKVKLIRESLDFYDLVIWLDVDALIYDLARDLRAVPLPDDKIGAVRFMLPSPHLNVGVLYFRNGKNTLLFMDKWLSRFPGRGAWHEQAEFNDMRDETVIELPKEWNYNCNGNALAKPVVMGFHGIGDAQNRLQMMRKVLS
jgi:hypothetical protein